MSFRAEIEVLNSFVRKSELQNVKNWQSCYIQCPAGYMLNMENTAIYGHFYEYHFGYEKLGKNIRETRFHTNLNNTGKILDPQS